MTANNLAVLYRSQGRDKEAETLFRQALCIFEQVLEPTHPHLLTCREPNFRN
jgi:Flp pilus assembly protein TadD